MADKPAEKKGEASGGEAAAAASGGGAKAWMPMIVTVALMPVLAFATTKYVLLPQVQKAMQAGGTAGAATASTAPAEGGGSTEKSGGESGGASSGGENKSGKVMVPISKVLVNVAGTMGTRYLMASMTLVGTGADFKGKIDDSKDQLLDLATGALSTKTIADLEKPGSRNLIRTELLNTFNNALGGPVVKEIYLTELAIQ
jgi:flagellar FliL protein